MLRSRPTLTMIHTPAPFRRIRLTAALASAAGIFLLGSPILSAQTRSALPPMPPTSTANPNSLPAPIAGSSSGANSSQRHRARVRYVDGLLEVRADNSSLNQILRDISRQTGMSIVGGVADERVFGTYGPAAPATVLKTLLDGTGTNMLLKETATEAPAELILTPQTGGASPPSPNSSSYDVTESEPELPLPGQAAPGAQFGGAVVQPVYPRAVTPQRAIPSVVTNPPLAPASSTTPSLPPTMPQPLNNVNGNSTNVSPTASTLPVVHSVPTDSLPTPSTAPSATGIVDAPNPPPQGTTTSGFTSQTPPDNNPNNPPSSTTAPGASQPKTPQQVYEELKQLQNQKQSTPAPQPKTTPQQPAQGSSQPQP